MEEYNSIIEVEVQIYKNHKLRNGMVYQLIFNKTKDFEPIEIDGVLVLSKPIQKTLTSTKPRIVNFKNYGTQEELSFLKENRSLRMLDPEENDYVGKGKIIDVNKI